jgi:hypothetical protein
MAAKMRFDQSEWVNDMVTGAVTGAAGALMTAMLVPDPPLLQATAIGGIIGLIIGMIDQPTRWLLNKRPRPDDPEDRHDD